MRELLGKVSKVDGRSVLQEVIVTAHRRGPAAELRRINKVYGVDRWTCSASALGRSVVPNPKTSHMQASQVNKQRPDAIYLRVGIRAAMSAH